MDPVNISVKFEVRR